MRKIFYECRPAPDSSILSRKITFYDDGTYECVFDRAKPVRFYWKIDDGLLFFKLKEYEPWTRWTHRKRNHEEHSLQEHIIVDMYNSYIIDQVLLKDGEI